MKPIRLSVFLIITILFCFAGISFAHTGVNCMRAQRYSGGNPVPWPDYPRRPYDVKKYQVTLDWRKIFETRSQQFSGVNVITLLVTDTTQNITVDAGLMKIDTILINGNMYPQAQVQPYDGEHLIIPLPQNLQGAGNEITLRIAYHRDILINKGIYFYPKGLWDSYAKDSTREDIAYTMSEPTDAHYWMPCNDQPYDKSESEISIIVPNGIEAASNGTLTSKVPYTPTSTIWNWKSDEPIATYLMVADASTFIHWSDTHQRTSTPGDTVHLDFYAWPVDYYQTDSSGNVCNAHYFMSRETSQIMTWLEARFGGFPFSKYGQVPVSLFDFGGMEHQSITTIHRGWLRGDDDGIAHEMTHQWFGDKVTCETFKDIWLNEGFASYGESVWAEGWGLDQWYMNIIRGKARDYFNGQNDFPVYDPPADNVFNEATTYAKGACILHMLRRMVKNDTMFFGALRDYTNVFAYSTANTGQFRDYIGQRLGMDLYEYFDQWIFGALHPIYDIKWAQGKNNIVYLRVNQTQTVRDHFTMPMKFFAYHDALPQPDTLEFIDDLRSKAFQKVLAYTIDSLIFDHDELILSVDTMNYAPELSVRSEVAPNSVFTVYLEGNTILCKFDGQEQNGMIEVYNSAGMKISDAEVTSGEILKRIPCANFASGMYFVRFRNEMQKVSILH